MKKHLDHKVANGKLLRVKADLDDGIINSIKITGDFFIYPESAIIEIENLLKGMKIIDVEEKLNKFIENKEIQIIGFGVSDIIKIMENM